jgi:hypothetical protein
VTWTLSGHNACLARVVGVFVNMDRMIGSEFEKGLEKLRSVVETMQPLAEPQLMRHTT